MDILQLITHIKYIQHVCHFVSKADDSVTIKDLKEDFKKHYKTDMPNLNNQYFGVCRLITLVFIYEKIKDDKGDKGDKGDKDFMNDLKIIRHAIAHNQIASDEDGFQFMCRLGNVKLNYADVITFCEKIERDLYL